MEKARHRLTSTLKTKRFKHILQGEVDELDATINSSQGWHSFVKHPTAPGQFEMASRSPLPRSAQQTIIWTWNAQAMAHTWTGLESLLEVVTPVATSPSTVFSSPAHVHTN